MSAQIQQKELSPLTKAALQVVAGGSAGFVEVCIMQPLDVVKTRMQLGGSGVSRLYSMCLFKLIAFLLFMLSVYYV